MGPALARMTALDRSILAWERATAPWTIHLELTTPALDPDRVRAAAVTALRRHPRLDAAGDGRDWHRSAHPPEIDLRRTSIDDVGALRAELLDEASALDRPPHVRIGIAHDRDTDQDRLLLAVGHVPTDGAGALRYAVSLADAYRDDGADHPPDDPGTGEAVLARASGPAWARVAFAGGAALRGAAGSVAAPMRLGDDGASTHERTSCVSRRLDREALVDQGALVPGATVNDLLVAGAHLAIDRHHAAAGPDTGRVSVAVPVDLRDDRGPPGTPVANLSVPISVVTDGDQRRDLATALAAVRAQTDPTVRRGRVREMLALVQAADASPAGRATAGVVASSGLVDTTTLSNLGIVSAPDFGPGGAGDLWFSPPCPPTLGVVFGVVTVGDHVHLVARHREDRVGAGAAHALLDLLCTAVTAP